MSQKPLVYVYSNQKFDPEIGVSQYKIDKLLKHFDVCFPEDLEVDPKKIGQIEGAVVYPSRFHLMKPYLPKLTLLKVVSSITTGMDTFPVEIFKQMGVKVGNTPAYRQQNKTVANYGLLLMLALARNFKQELGYMTVNAVFSINRNVGEDVTDKVLGIVGLGRIGKELASLAKALHMKVFYHNRSPREGVLDVTYYQDLDSMLPVCDYITICCPHNRDSHHMFSKDQFKIMKSTARIINISRGQIINTNDLTEALQTGEIYGAALDVTDPEPLPQGHPLLTLPNVIITLHCAAFTVQGRDEVWDMIIENLKAGIAGEPLPYEV